MSPTSVLVCALGIITFAGCAVSTHTAQPGDRTETVARAITRGRARSVILLIGDGMGDSEITMARNYYVGAAGRLALDTLPLTGAYTTYAVQEGDPHLPDYVVDSAASATAWATGHKTSNRRISTTAGTDELLPTILELAQRRGLGTGSVTTAELTDATPAAIAAHVNHRSCQGPADMTLCPRYRKAAGGLGSIVEQSVDRHVDVLLGGGTRRFDQVIDGGPYRGQSVLQSAIAQGYTVVTDAAGLQAAEAGHRLLGLFAEKDMSVEWSGAPAAVFPGSGPQRCLANRRPATEPGLAAMTRKAIELLDDGKAGAPGFFLQVEGASIDKRGHAADPCGQIGETIAFDAAVRVVLEYAGRHPDTLVIVTGDHGQTSQIVSQPNEFGQSPGLLSTLTTNEGAPMTIGYATSLPGASQAHTGTQIRIAAQGPQAANVIGVTDQTALFTLMARALGLLP